MAKRSVETPAPTPEARADQAMREALEAGERRHLEYVATLDPREREQLAPWSKLTAAV